MVGSTVTVVTLSGISLLRTGSLFSANPETIMFPVMVLVEGTRIIAALVSRLVNLLAELLVSCCFS